MCASGDIGDEEFLFRKIPVSTGWYDATTNTVSPLAFNPRADDISGISLDRAHSETHPEFRTPESAATGKSKQGYYIAVLCAAAVREAGLTVVSKPIEGNAGHAEIPEITYENRKSDRSEEFKVVLAHKLVDHVLGPFPPVGPDS